MSYAQPTETGITVPVVREISLSVEDLLHSLLNLAPSRRVSILDSCGVRSPDARYLIAGFDPFEIVEAYDNEVRITRTKKDEIEVLSVDVLDILDERLEKFRVLPQSNMTLAGACIASFSYEMARTFEHLPSFAARNSPAEPNAVLAFYDTLVVHDYLHSTTKIVGSAGLARLMEFQEALSNASGKAEEGLSELTPHKATSNFTRDEYINAVRRIKEHIAAGDIYQANLTQQISVPLAGSLSPERIFLNLRRDNPASFTAFIRRRDDVVISASPERFLRVEVSDTERTIEAWPIKGTRPRGEDVETDARLRAELAQSEKDRAENIMIVDLLRNDLGRVCRYGTVTVPELFTVQEHPTLFHLVSKVRGVLREDVTAGELLRACFPCGSITGAPKLRAMEILYEIESVARALSMGAIGYLSFDGALDLSVAIRTMTLRDSIARFNVGGGIVTDSQPEDEYEESLTKARALLRSLNAQL